MRVFVCDLRLVYMCIAIENPTNQKVKHQSASPLIGRDITRLIRFVPFPVLFILISSLEMVASEFWG